MRKSALNIFQVASFVGDGFLHLFRVVSSDEGQTTEKLPSWTGPQPWVFLGSTLPFRSHLWKAICLEGGLLSTIPRNLGPLNPPKTNMTICWVSCTIGFRCIFYWLAGDFPMLVFRGGTKSLRWPWSFCRGGFFQVKFHLLSPDSPIFQAVLSFSARRKPKGAPFTSPCCRRRSRCHGGHLSHDLYFFLFLNGYKVGPHWLYVRNPHLHHWQQVEPLWVGWQPPVCWKPCQAFHNVAASGEWWKTAVFIHSHGKQIRPGYPHVSQFICVVYRGRIPDIKHGRT